MLCLCRQLSKILYWFDIIFSNLVNQLRNHFIMIPFFLFLNNNFNLMLIFRRQIFLNFLSKLFIIISKLINIKIMLFKIRNKWYFFAFLIDILVRFEFAYPRMKHNLFYA